MGGHAETQATRSLAISTSSPSLPLSASLLIAWAVLLMAPNLQVQTFVEPAPTTRQPGGLQLQQ